MGLVTTLARHIGGEETYECTLCANTFDRERRNCPACGSARIERAS